MRLFEQITKRGRESVFSGVRSSFRRSCYTFLEHVTKRDHERIDSDAASAVTWFCSAPLLRLGQWTVLLAAVVSAASLSAADWPCYSADTARTSASTQRLAFPLTSAWTYHPVQPPAPAWPEPGREQHRLDFDYAFQPVVAGGRVFFGSSADDTVRALGLADGQVQWQFTAGGPIRFAPAYADGNLYVAIYFLKGFLQPPSLSLTQ